MKKRRDRKRMNEWTKKNENVKVKKEIVNEKQSRKMQSRQEKLGDGINTARDSALLHCDTALTAHTQTLTHSPTHTDMPRRTEGDLRQVTEIVLGRLGAKKRLQGLVPIYLLPQLCKMLLLLLLPCLVRTLYPVAAGSVYSSPAAPASASASSSSSSSSYILHLASCRWVYSSVQEKLVGWLIGWVLLYVKCTVMYTVPLIIQVPTYLTICYKLAGPIGHPRSSTKYTN